MGTLLHFNQIRKSFSGNVVLDGIDFTVGEGEIVSLVGENGAGKSTLMNILFGMGVIRNTGGYEGKIIWNGEEAHINSPEEAMEYGIGMVHQEFMLLPGFTVARNIKLNREAVKPNVISKIAGQNYKTVDEKTIYTSAEETLNWLGVDIAPEVKVESLPVGYKQFVEIAREVSKDDLKLLVLDEPTAVLTESEAARFIDCIKKVSAKGIAVIFISHRLEEVLELSNKVVVLRDGKKVFESSAAKTNKKEIASYMVGRSIDDSIEIQDKGRDVEQFPVAMELQHMKVSMPGEYSYDINLKIHEGEILGIGGLAGQGKMGISNAIFGMYPATGKVLLDGKELHYGKIGEALKHGLAFVSEDRKGVGLLLSEPIDMNMVYTDMQLHGNYLKRHGFFTTFDKAAAEKDAEEMIKAFNIRCTGPDQVVGSLSGGNQQKVCMSRALLTKPRILFVSEPTRGIDIGAKQLLLNYLVKINREKDITIVITSSELNELRSVCDRIAIISNGVVQGILKPDDSSVNFALLMSGEEVKEGE